MPRQVALLRGINLGSNRRVSMADLRKVLEHHGYEDVRTHLQSGNVVLSSPLFRRESSSARWSSSSPPVSGPRSRCSSGAGS